MTLFGWLAGAVVVVVAFNIGSVDGILTGTGNRTGPAIIDFICSLDLLTLPSGFL